MLPNPYKSKFILFEGIDGSGKSEQYSRIQEAVKNHKAKVLYSKEPDSKRPVGKIIYEILNGKNKTYQLDKMADFHIQSFYIEDRMDNYRENIIPGLEQGRHIFQDRGIPSTISYGSKDKKQFYDFMGLHDRVFSAGRIPFIWPDLILIFDVPPKVAIQRMEKGGKKLDKFEHLGKLKKARENYLAFAKMYPNCVVIDGRPSLEEVFKETKNNVFKLLGFKF